MSTAGYPQLTLAGIAEDLDLSQLRILIAPQLKEQSSLDSLQQIVNSATALQWLDLSGCTLPTLPKLHNLTSLQLLNLSGCAQLVREKSALDRLKLSLRRLKIVTGRDADLASLLTVAGHDDCPATKDSLGKPGLPILHPPFASELPSCLPPTC